MEADGQAPVLLVENQDQQRQDTHHKSGKEEEAEEMGGAREGESESVTTSLRICSLDPGVRTFQTVFDVNEGSVPQVGDKRYEPYFPSLQSSGSPDQRANQGEAFKAEVETEACCSAFEGSYPKFD